MENSMDLSSVVSLIMKHPELIEQIAALAKGEEASASGGASVDGPVPTEPTTSTAFSQGKTLEGGEGGTREVSKSENRKRLFSAIRPFLSEERARTLSSVEAVVSILDSMHS